MRIKKNKQTKKIKMKTKMKLGRYPTLERNLKIIPFIKVEK
jgi:hypothetical protein